MPLRRHRRLAALAAVGVCAAGATAAVALNPELRDWAIDAGRDALETTRVATSQYKSSFLYRMDRAERVIMDIGQQIVPPKVDVSPYEAPESVLRSSEARRTQRRPALVRTASALATQQWPFGNATRALYRSLMRMEQRLRDAQGPRLHPSALPDALHEHVGKPEAFYPTYAQVNRFFERMQLMEQTSHTRRVLDAVAREARVWSVAHEEEEKDLESTWGEIGIAVTSAVKQHDPSASTNALTALAIFAEESEAHAQHFLRHGGLDLLRSVLIYTWTASLGEEVYDLVRMEASRVVANLSIYPSSQVLLSQSGLLPLLRQWASHPDIRIQSQAVRALCNMRAGDGSPRYADGVFPMEPAAALHDGGAYDVDLVFVHGLAGGAFVTWKSAATQSTDSPQVDSWPRAWLPAALGARLNKSSYEKVEPDGLRPRMTAIDYDTDLSEWTSAIVRRPELSLEDRAKEVLNKLLLAGVGKERPVVFVTHSMGGLLVKRMLVATQEPTASEEQKGMLARTAGVVFYSTPHRGAQLATSSMMFRYIVLPSLDVQQLQASKALLDLNDRFHQLSRRLGVPVLSFGETESLGIVGEHVRSLVVPPESSDPGYGRFVIAAGKDHVTVCKAESTSDIVFISTANFIREAVRAHGQRKFGLFTHF